MFIPSLRVEWSFCKCTNASSVSLPSSVTDFDKVICVCVCVHSLSCLIHCASFSSLTQFLTYLRNEKTSLSTTLCTPLPSNLPILLPFRSGSRRPWTGSPGAHPWVQGERFYHRAAAQWWSVAEPASMDNLFSYCICISCLWDFCS